MSATAFTRRRIALVAIVAGALMAPVAQADPGGAFERALANREPAPSFNGSPDAFERALPHA